MAIYNGKHVVFEETILIDSGYSYNPSTDNSDDNGCINNYEISNIRNKLSSTILPKLSDNLTSQLTSTTIKTAKNGISTTLVSTSDKLFLPACKEISTTPAYSVSQENNALTTWTYWTTHTTQSDRIKYDSTSTARAYWLRSPKSDSTSYVADINNNGLFDYNFARNIYTGISSCFAW